MPLDPSSGTWVYAGSDAASPTPGLFNLLANSVVTAINAAKARLTTLESDVKARSYSARKGGTALGLPASAYATVLTITLPASAPAGVYEVRGFATTFCSTAVQHFRKVSWGGVDQPGGADGHTAPAGQDYTQSPVVATITHTGGAVIAALLVQVNGAAGTAFAHPNCALQVTYVGRS